MKKAFIIYFVSLGFTVNLSAQISQEQADLNVREYANGLNIPVDYSLYSLGFKSSNSLIENISGNPIFSPDYGAYFFTL